MRQKIIKIAVVTAVLLVICLLAVYISGYYSSYTAPEGITAALDQISQGIHSNDERQFLAAIDADNKEFYVEEKHLFKDIQNMAIKDFSMRIVSCKPLDNAAYKVGIAQEYTMEGKTVKLRYDAVFKKYGTVYKFSDLYFETQETQYFIIKYAPSLKKQKEKLAAFVDDAYKNVKQVYGKAPEDKTVLKLYDNNAVFGAFIKPSIKFRMGGWYEYPESIKINMSALLDRVIPDGTFNSIYLETLSHELTHRTNGIETNNNVPYWIAEGLATFVQNKGAYSTKVPQSSLSELETINLEQLTDNIEIDAYYNDAYVYISRFIKKYGMDKLHQLLLEMGKYPLQENTAGEIYLESNKRFHDVVQKQLSISMKQLEAELYNRIK